MLNHLVLLFKASLIISDIFPSQSPGKWTGPARSACPGPDQTVRTVSPLLRLGHTAAAAWCGPAPACRWSCSSTPDAALRGRFSDGRWGWLQGGGGGWVGGGKCGEFMYQRGSLCSRSADKPFICLSFTHIYYHVSVTCSSETQSHIINPLINSELAVPWQKTEVAVPKSPIWITAEKQGIIFRLFIVLLYCYTGLYCYADVRWLFVILWSNLAKSDPRSRKNINIHVFFFL